jgi:DNA-binding MarR family transcriptional regulator
MVDRRHGSDATNPQEPEADARPTGTWGFLTNHAHVLLCIARDPRSRARDIAAQVGITERATQRILADLIADGYVTRTKIGRRNNYKINPRGQLRHPALRDLSIGSLIDVLNGDGQHKPPAHAASTRRR